MSRSARRRAGTAPGWWMTPGPALCPCCEQPHQVEAMLYCSDCDGIVCAVCVVISIDCDPRCPICHASRRSRLMAARAIWKAVIHCGKLPVPVKLYSAIEDRNIRFRVLSRKR
jgi:hypothetical protein